MTEKELYKVIDFIEENRLGFAESKKPKALDKVARTNEYTDEVDYYPESGLEIDPNKIKEIIGSLLKTHDAKWRGKMEDLIKEYTDDVANEHGFDNEDASDFRDELYRKYGLDKADKLNEKE